MVIDEIVYAGNIQHGWGNISEKEPVRRFWDEVSASLDMTKPSDRYFLIYYEFNRPGFREFYFDDDSMFHMDVIDTWEMRVEGAGKHCGHFRIELPAREYIAVRIIKKS